METDKRYKGYRFKKFRVSQKRPQWGEYPIQRRVEFLTLRDMAAMINYVLVRNGMPYQVPWERLSRWEWDRPPLWFRISAMTLYDEFRTILADAKRYRFIDGKYPTLEWIG